MKLRPLFSNIVLEEVEETEQKTASGIVLPETSQSQSQQKLGKVLAIGNGEHVPAIVSKLAGPNEADTWVDELAKIPMEVKVDDIVVFRGWGSNTIKLEGKDYILITQKDVLAVVDK